MAFQSLDNLDARRVFFRRAITEIKEKIEVLSDQFFDMRNAVMLSLEDCYVPFRFWKEGAWVTGPVVIGKWIFIEILRCQKANTQITALPRKSFENCNS